MHRWLVLVLLTSGCLGGASPPPETSPTQETAASPSRPLDGVVVTGDARTDASWTYLETELEGAAGAWAIGYRELPKGFRGAFAVESEVQATGAPGVPVRLWTFAPQWVDNKSGLRIAPLAHQGFVVEPTLGTARWSDAVTTTSGGQAVGIFFAVASDAAWRARFFLTLLEGPEGGEYGDGDTVGPSHVAGRRGAQLEHALATTPVAGTTELVAQVGTPGWSHVSVLWKRPPLCPRPGERSWHVTFPNATANVEHAMQPYGRYDYAGTFTDVAGTLRARIEYQEQSTGADLGLVHMPTEPSDFPRDAILGAYRRSNDSRPCEG